MLAGLRLVLDTFQLIRLGDHFRLAILNYSCSYFAVIITMLGEKWYFILMVPLRHSFNYKKCFTNIRVLDMCV